MLNPNSAARPSILIACGVAIFGLTGCSTLSSLQRPEQQDIPVEAAEEAPYFVEMHSNFGKPKLYKGQITKPTTVQEALEVSGAYGSMKSMTVDLYRPLPDGTPLKLPIEFKKSKQVKFEQDYALHPGDRLIVRPKSNSPVDMLVDQLF